MGRFYKTATPTYTNNIVADLDADLMLGTLQVHDKALTKSKEEAGVIGDLFSDMENLQGDNEIVNKTKEDFYARKDTLIDKISNDPANYIKYNSEITKLSRDIQKSMDNGILKRASENFAQKGEIDTTIDSSNANESTKEYAKRVTNLKYAQEGGLNWQDANRYNQFQGDSDPLNLRDAFDEAGFIDALNLNYRADKTSKSGAGSRNGYITSVNGHDEFVTEESVERYMNDYMKNNDWEEVTKQEILLKLQSETGDVSITNDDARVKEKLEIQRTAFINSAKNKIGYNQETKTVSKTGDSTWQYKQNAIKAMNVEPNTVQSVDNRSQVSGDKESKLSMDANLEVVAKSKNITEAQVWEDLKKIAGDDPKKAQDNITNYLTTNGLTEEQADAFYKGGSKNYIKSTQLQKSSAYEGDELEWNVNEKAVSDRMKTQEITRNTHIIVTDSNGKEKLIENTNYEGNSLASVLQSQSGLLGINVGGATAQVPAIGPNGNKIPLLDEDSNLIGYKMVDVTQASDNTIMSGAQTMTVIDMFGVTTKQTSMRVELGDGDFYTISFEEGVEDTKLTGEGDYGFSE